MIAKDYYKILEVKDTATQADIKKSYRRLAMKYHPDKNFDKKVFELKFREIREAYDVLSNEKQRQLYNHRQYDLKHGLNKKTPGDFTTPQAILKRTNQLRSKVAQMDPNRIDKDALNDKIQQILSVKNIQLLLLTNNELITVSIIEDLLQASIILEHHQTKQICMQLATIAGTNNSLHQKIHSFQQRHRLNQFWNAYQPLVAIVSAIIFCLLIYILST